VAKKLTQKQWDAIKKRLDNKEKAADLAKEFGVTRQAISNRFRLQNKAIKSVANQIVEAETSIRSSLQKLPPNLQIEAVNLANELMSISTHLASGAKYGAMTFHRLAGIANQHAQTLDDKEPDIKVLATIGALTKIANENATTGLNLLNANKDTIKEANGNTDLQPLTFEEFKKLQYGEADKRGAV